MTAPSFILTPERSPHESILTSRSPFLSRSSITPLQSQVDGWVGGFVGQATDWRSLAAITAGGMAYRMGRVGILGFGVGAYGRTPLRVASIAAGLTAEVSAFEITHRTLQDNPNLWHWSGHGGIRQGLLQSFITFGTLKGTGHLAQSENLIARHLLQDTAMVLGHNVSGALGLHPRPTGTLAEQFLHAEATNLQIIAGMGLAHRLAPGIHGLERGLDLVSRSAFSPTFPFQPLQPGYALAGVSGEKAAFSSNREIKTPFISQMSAEEGRGGGGSGDPFLPWIRDRRSTAAPERIFAAEELNLLSELEGATWQARWEILGRLRNLYTKNMARKGLVGLHALRQLYGMLNTYVRANNLFHLLLERNEQGKLYFSPWELQPPFSFRALKEFPSDPAIFTSRGADNGMPHQAYFPIDRLILAQDIYNKEKVEEIIQNWGTKPLPPVLVAFDPERGFHHLRDGYHRLIAASRLGYTHLRGQVSERFRLSSPPIPLSEIRPVSPEEYARIAQERDYGAGVSVGSILFDSETGNPKE